MDPANHEFEYTPSREEPDEAFWFQSSKQGFSFNDSSDVDPLQLDLDVSSIPVDGPLPRDLRLDLPDHLQDAIILNGPRDGEIRRTTSEVKDHVDKAFIHSSKSSSLTIIKKIFKDGDKTLAAKLKSKQDKLLYLDKAIDRSDGDFILAAVLHMKRTLNTQLFLNSIKQRPLAFQTYVNYLRCTNQTAQLLDLLSSQMDCPEDLAITALEKAVKVPDSSSDSTSGIDKKISRLRECNRHYFVNSPAQSKDLLEFWSSLINDEISLLERQLPIELEDRRVESQRTNEANAKFLEIPRKPLLGLPLMTTLCYCCLYHDELQENCLASPVAIKKFFNLNDKQYAFAALVAFSLRKRWDLVDSLFQNKSWLLSKKFKAIIDFEEIARTLIKYEAPSEMITKYVSAIDDIDQRLQFAREHRLEKVLKSVSISSLKR